MEPEDELEQATDTNAQARRPGQATEPIGAVLRRAREAAGLSIQDVAERTRVPARHLSAIDEARYHELPALAYSAGFVRAYAQAVGLNGTELAAQFRTEANPDPVPHQDLYEPVDPARVPSSMLAWVAGGVGLVAVVCLIIFGTGLFSSEQTAGEIVLNDAQQEQAAALAVNAASETAGNDGSVQAALATDAPAGPVAVPPAASNGQVVLKASEDAWIKVYDRSGQTVRMGILAAGESYPVPGDPNQLLLWTGKAGAVQVSVNGRPVAPLGKLVQTVRDVSLAPASLLAKPMPDQPASAAVPAGQATR